MSESGLPFDNFFDKAEWKRDIEGVPSNVVMYRYKESDLRVVCMPGKVPGTDIFCGTYMMFRSEDDSMNMEVSVPLQSKYIFSVLSTAIDLSAGKKLSHDKFLDTFNRWYSEKLMTTLRNLPRQAPAASTSSTTQAQSHKRPIDTVNIADDDDKSVQSSPKRSSTASTAGVVVEEKLDCCFCKEREADTVAIPCGHSVVCTQCSLSLNKNVTHARKCIYCRQDMTHVAYPDNTIKPVGANHEATLFEEPDEEKRVSATTTSTRAPQSMKLKVEGNLAVKPVGTGKCGRCENEYELLTGDLKLPTYGNATTRTVFWTCDNCKNTNYGFEEHREIVLRIAAVEAAKRPQRVNCDYD